MGSRWTLERALREKPPSFHPLGGCDWANFSAHLKAHGDFTGRTASQRRKSRLAVLARHPFTVMEKWVFSRKVDNHQLPHPPTFLIGHWRSGTTFLHNLLVTNPHFSTIDFGQTAMPHNLLNPTRFIGRAAVASVIPKDRGMDGVKMGIREPQEEEMALGNLNPICYYNVFYYPKEMKEQFDRAIFLEGVSDEERAAFLESYQKLLRKLSIAGKGKPLLLKNPASTARIPLLQSLFPDVRFVHIVRNPFEVFASMLHHYPRLFNAFAWQDFSEIDLEEMVFYKYRRLMQSFLDQRIAAGDRLFETSYEKVIADPLTEVGKIYRHLGIAQTPDTEKALRDYLKKIDGYRRNRYQLTRKQVERIQNEWGFALKEWNYDIPESIAIG